MFRKQTLHKLTKCSTGDMVQHLIIKYRARNYNINLKWLLGDQKANLLKKYNKSISKVTMAIRRQTMNFFQSNDHWSAVVMYKSFIALHKNLYLPLTILHMQRKTLSFE